MAPVLDGYRKFEAKQRGEELNAHHVSPEGETGRRIRGWTSSLSREQIEHYIGLFGGRIALNTEEMRRDLQYILSRDYSGDGYTMGVRWHVTRNVAHVAMYEWASRNPPSEQQEGLREDSERSVDWRIARSCVRTIAGQQSDTVIFDGLAFIRDAAVGITGGPPRSRTTNVQGVADHYRTPVEAVFGTLTGWLVYASEAQQSRGIPGVRCVWSSRSGSPQDTGRPNQDSVERGPRRTVRYGSLG